MANTRRRIQKRTVLNRVAVLIKEGADIGIDLSYGGYRITNRAGDRWMSPRLGAHNTIDWLDAYFEGYVSGMVRMGQGILDRIAEPGDKYVVEAERGRSKASGPVTRRRSKPATGPQP